MEAKRQYHSKTPNPYQVVNISVGSTSFGPLKRSFNKSGNEQSSILGSIVTKKSKRLGNRYHSSARTSPEKSNFNNGRKNTPLRLLELAKNPASLIFLEQQSPKIIARVKMNLEKEDKQRLKQNRLTKVLETHIRDQRRSVRL